MFSKTVKALFIWLTLAALPLPDLLPILPKDGRVVNLSSAAQAPVDVNAMAGQGSLSDMDAYSQSTLAITIWSQEMARELPDGPLVVAVNPGSLLASKMVKEGFGIAGNDMQIGVDILCRAALSDEFVFVIGIEFLQQERKFQCPEPVVHFRYLGPEVIAVTLGQAAGGV